MKYKVRLRLSEEGVAASVPGLPGCWSQGRDEEEALSNIEAAIKEHLAAVEDLLSDAGVRYCSVSPSPR